MESVLNCMGQGQLKLLLIEGANFTYVTVVRSISHDEDL